LFSRVRVCSTHCAHWTWTDCRWFRWFQIFSCIYIYTSMYVYLHIIYIHICIIHNDLPSKHTCKRYCSCFSDTSDLARSLDFRMLPRQIAQGSNPTSPWCSIPIHIWGFP
jgi:hypothetical protein